MLELLREGSALTGGCPAELSGPCSYRSEEGGRGLLRGRPPSPFGPFLGVFLGVEIVFKKRCKKVSKIRSPGNPKIN